MPEKISDQQGLLQALTEEGLLSLANRERLEQMQSKSKRRILQLATEAGFFSEEELVEHLSRYTGLEKVDLQQDFSLHNWDDYFDFFVNAQIIPLNIDEHALHLAVFDPLDHMLFHSIEVGLQKKIKMSLAPQKDITRFWDEKLKTDDDIIENDIEYLMDVASEAPVVRVVNDILSRAVELGASDIHLEARGNDLKLRYRIDGILHDFSPPPSGMGPAVISRIKILSNLDIAEQRIPQDGGMKLPTSAKEVDVRVSVMPSVHGESVVLRILDKGHVQLEFESLGITGQHKRTLLSMLDKSHGMLVVTGPTGAGKSTTLYTALQHVLSSERKIVTIEDPVEYKMKSITQIQVNPKAGLSFAAGLRSVLRHDPDVILVGEMRDGETAGISIQAALTGHLVLSTLHANQASQVFSRLTDMGVEPFLTCSALFGSMAQRLVRRLCPQCKKKVAPSSALQDRFGLKADSWLYSGQGCSFCGGTGYKGRVGIYEILPMNEELETIVLRQGSAAEIEQAARKYGFKPLLEDGLNKALAGQTSIEEVLRVAG